MAKIMDGDIGKSGGAGGFANADGPGDSGAGSLTHSITGDSPPVDIGRWHSGTVGGIARSNPNPSVKNAW